ncbi:lysophospholipid acyltransferase family protein [Sulfobacillus harzensis]|uniref:1-acyl-sn-glycerol-3-phosphate acyltransferase n=1 Tax=Sulfobacillus harzensis TaxID=2729629 RepID=A0A7Y0L3K3_9FIRM|nr:lysophospholipid acyltransferase family protein [Sulfobacillus harzensis]NMP22453.1 1-acyl-sn-glycerol-3-phosphate acyltransferase [Sulfobacillus harzensis]
MVVYWALYWAVRVVLSLYFRVRVYGLERVPREGPLIVIANHRSGFDPPMVGALMPRPVHFMTKVELFSYPLLPLVFKYVQAYPVRRGRPDRQAIRHSLDILRRGEVILLFPEGHRTETGDLQEARSGVVYLAQKTACQLIPIGISGEYRFRRTIRYVVGEPFTIDPQMSRREAQTLVMEKIRDLVQEGESMGRR